MRARLFILPVFILSLLSCFEAVAAKKRSRTKNQFNFEDWQKKYGKKVDLKQWLETHPLPWNNYFNQDNSDCAKSWYIQLGPLGLRTLMHDKTYAGFPGFKSIFPKFLCQNGELQYNTFEILNVDENGPLKGRILPGDFLIAIDGKKFISGENLPEGKKIRIANMRSLELHAGLLIDRAEGRGEITLTVLRVPESRKNGTFLSPNELKRYQKVIKAKIPRLGSFGSEVTADNPKLFNLSLIMAERLISQQNEDGSWSDAPCWASNTFYTSMCGLGLIAFDAKKYREQIRKAAHFVAYQSSYSDWTYDRGTIIIFLAEYYLRYRDKSILKGLEWIMDEAAQCVQEDYVAGHKKAPGYGGCGWIGGGEAIACGLAVASYTPIKKYNKLLDNMLLTIQNMSPHGKVPYGRGGKPSPFDGNSEDGQAWSSATGPYLTASLIRGGTEYFTKVTSARFKKGPWGDVDEGHATHTLTFTWGSIATACTSTEAHLKNLSSFIWRLTTHREFSGMALSNASRLEYMKCEHIIGLPYWHAGGMLILLNGHKRNLAITGNPRFRAKEYRPAQLVNQHKVTFYNSVEQSLALVKNKLGKRCPKALSVAISRLRKIPKDEKLADSLFSFLKTEMPPIALEISKIRGISPLDQVYLTEMVLFVDHKIVQVQPGKKEGESSVTGINGLKVTSVSVFDTWKNNLSAETKAPNFAPLLKFTGSVKFIDRNKKALTSEKVVQLEPGKESVFPVSVADKDYQLMAVFNYSVGGLKISYKRPIVLNSTNQRKLSVNNRKIWVNGFLHKHCDYHWMIPFRLADGTVISASDHCDWTTERKAVIFKERGKVVNLNTMGKILLKGTPCKFWVETGSYWDFFVHEVDVLDPEYRIIKPKTTILSGDWSGSSTNLYDELRNTSIESNGSKNPSIILEMEKPSNIKSVVWTTASGQQNHGGFTLELYVKGRWRTAVKGSTKGAWNQIVDLPNNKSQKLRLVFDLVKGSKLKIGELQVAL